MKIAEAIRLGSMMTRQCFGRMSRTNEAGEVETCAMGAALLAVGELTPDKTWHSSISLSTFENLHKPIRLVCSCGTRLRNGCACNLDSVITHLNDAHRWTRERIADWVETVEDSPEESMLTVEGVATPAFAPQEAWLAAWLAAYPPPLLAEAQPHKVTSPVCV